MKETKKTKKTQSQPKKESSPDLKRTIDETSVNVAGIATEVISQEQRLDELERIVGRIKKRLGL
tara:strand:- start:291 stop:482 length:192 start_codon:yes stop_codon:yes gene_type:complete